MPIHDFRCARGHQFTAYQKVAQTRAEEQCPDCHAEGVEANGQKVFLTPPMVRCDIPAYQSPVDGQWVNSRAQRREDMARNGCVEYDRDRSAEARQRAAQQDDLLERSVEETVSAELSRMPARKLEKLAEEVHAGASAEIVRRAP